MNFISIGQRTLLPCFVVVILSGCTPTSDSTAVSYIVENNLFAIHSDGTKELIDVYPDSDTPNNEVIRVSQNQKYLAYTKWEDAHYVIYVADMPNLSNVRMVAEQTVGEGSGGLDIASLGWIDDSTLEYREEIIACGETGSPTLQNPTTDCDGSIINVYRVNIDTSEKELSDQWLQKILPLQ